MKNQEDMFKGEKPSTTARYTSKACFGLATGFLGLSTACGVLSAIPVVNYIAHPLKGGCTISAYGLYGAAALIDPTNSRELHGQRKKINYIKNGFQAGEAGFGVLAGVAFVLSFSPLAPITLPIAFGALTCANISIGCAEIVSLIDHWKYSKSTGPAKGFKVAGDGLKASSEFIGAGSCVLVTAGLIATLVYPPVGGALLAAGLGTAVAGVAVKGVAFGCQGVSHLIEHPETRQKIIEAPGKAYRTTKDFVLHPKEKLSNGLDKVIKFGQFINPVPKIAAGFNGAIEALSTVKQKASDGFSSLQNALGLGKKFSDDKEITSHPEISESKKPSTTDNEEDSPQHGHSDFASSKLSERLKNVTEEASQNYATLETDDSQSEMLLSQNSHKTKNNDLFPISKDIEPEPKPEPESESVSKATTISSHKNPSL